MQLTNHSFGDLAGQIAWTWTGPATHLQRHPWSPGKGEALGAPGYLWRLWFLSPGPSSGHRAYGRRLLVTHTSPDFDLKSLCPMKSSLTIRAQTTPHHPPPLTNLPSHTIINNPIELSKGSRLDDILYSCPSCQCVSSDLIQYDIWQVQLSQSP